MNQLLLRSASRGFLPSVNIVALALNRNTRLTDSEEF